MIIYQLSRPISYLAIKDKAKWKIDWLLPLIISISCSAIFFTLPIEKTIYGNDGFIRDLQGFLQILPGFYLAALAAIATFNKNDLDFHLPPPTPQIEIIIQNQKILINLTRRIMLSDLFGYLTFLSLMIYIFIVVGSIMAPNSSFLFKNYYEPIKIISFFVGNLFFWQMIIITIFGLYQLCDRIHQPDNTTN